MFIYVDFSHRSFFLFAGSGAIGPDGYKPGALIKLCQLVEVRSRGRYGLVWLSKMRGLPNNKEDTMEREVAVKVFPPQVIDALFRLDKNHSNLCGRILEPQS